MTGLDEISVCAELHALNPRASENEVRAFVDQLRTYRRAQENLLEVGEVCVHPQTGAPMVNPWLKPRDDALRMMQGMHLKAGPTAALWP